MVQAAASKTGGGAAPDFSRETALRARLGARALICGVDEVGRGPFAGPVVAGAAVLSRAAADALRRAGLDDSKKLNPRRRAALHAQLREAESRGEALLALGAASVAEIDRINIGQAVFVAMRRAVADLTRRAGRPLDFALVDGKFAPPGLGAPAETVIGGDGASLSIAAAALHAKQTRDGLMQRLAARYPAYGWETNAGYGGAPIHRAAILRYGLTPHHRPGFCRRLLSGAWGDANNRSADGQR